jgi:hypothetical protein
MQFAWVACLAILFGALAPSLTHAFAKAAVAGSMEVCTSSGIKLIAQPADGGKHAGAKHCGYCAMHNVSPGLIPPSNALIVARGAFALAPSLFYRAAHALFPWTVAASRAPPQTA